MIKRLNSRKLFNRKVSGIRRNKKVGCIKMGKKDPDMRRYFQSKLAFRVGLANALLRLTAKGETIFD
jgi:hypothetical protein